MLKNTTVNMMIKNEESYIKQAIKSTAPYVNRFIIYDTGSTDKTIEYVKVLQKDYPHIELNQILVSGDSINWNGNHLSQALTDVRNTMIKESKTKWIWQVDGDEIYSKKSIDKIAILLEKLEKPEYDWVIGIMVKIKWCISDTQYTLPGPFDRTLRVFKNNGVWIGKFPEEFYYVNGQPITILDRRCVTVDADFMHLSMALHSNRRPDNGEVHQLDDLEIEFIGAK